LGLKDVDEVDRLLENQFAHVQAQSVLIVERASGNIRSCHRGAELSDYPEAVQPNVHIFTRSKLPWLDLPKDMPVFESFYNINAVSSVQSLERLRRNAAELAYPSALHSYQES
jgi:hypothetical protein